MENLRKRTERDVADTRAYAIAGFARDMLTATDALSRALVVIPAETRETADGALKSLIDGIELADREMQRLLAKHGVKPIEAAGQKFDPHKHQAMFEVPNTEVPEGTVVQVVQEGFAIGDRVLRPAMVGVAKGGAAAAPGTRGQWRCGRHRQERLRRTELRVRKGRRRAPFLLAGARFVAPEARGPGRRERA